jgi:DNA-binding HxlR family transcriptional regulator
MEILTKLITLSAFVIGVLALERTWHFYDLQRRFREISTQITQRNLNILETATTLAARIHEVTHRNRKPPDPTR